MGAVLEAARELFQLAPSRSMGPGTGGSASAEVGRPGARRTGLGRRIHSKATRSDLERRPSRPPVDRRGAGGQQSIGIARLKQLVDISPRAT